MIHTLDDGMIGSWMARAEVILARIPGGVENAWRRGALHRSTDDLSGPGTTFSGPDRLVRSCPVFLRPAVPPAGGQVATTGVACGVRRRQRRRRAAGGGYAAVASSIASV